MAKIRINGDTSGYIEISAPAVAGSTSITLPATTGGSLLATDASGNLNVDSGVLYVDGVNNRVGINTTSPARPVDVNGSIRLASGAVLEFGGTVTNYITGDNVNNYLAFGTGSSERLRITSSGFVGIGTASPNKPLQIYSGSADSEIRLQTNSGTEQNAYITLRNSGGNLDIYSVNGAITFNPANTERLRLDTSGRVLVGTTSGQGKFIVQDTLPKIQSNYINTNHLEFGVGGSGCGFAMTTGLFMTFNHQPYADRGTDNNLTERVRIASNGVFTSTSSLSDDFGFRIITNTGNQYNLGLYKSADQNTVNEDYIRGTGGATTRFRFVGNGGLYNYQSNNANLSDINTKKDISLAPNTWDCLKEWEIVTYRYKDQPDDADLSLGVIAQQVAESCPEIITVFQPATEEEPEKLGVKEQQMYWMAIKALQEAQLRIEQLEATNASFEARLSALEVKP